MPRCTKWIILLAFFWPVCGRADLPAYTWTFLTTEKDSRPADVHECDEALSRKTVEDMNITEKVFHGNLTWRKMNLSRLLSASAPFCELDVDPAQPSALTSREAVILKEYLERGGFLLLSEDAYPYTLDQIATFTKWPIIDFVTRHLPAIDSNFTAEKLTEKHPLYHSFYKTKIPLAEKRALRDMPNLPDLTLVSYKGHPCAFVYASDFCEDDHWVTMGRPFPTDSVLVPEDYALYVNLYVYVSMH